MSEIKNTTARKEKRQAWWKKQQEKQNATETSSSSINLRVRKPPEDHSRQAAVVETAGGFKLKLRLAASSGSAVKSSKTVSKKETQNAKKSKTKAPSASVKTSPKSQNQSSPKKKPGPKPKNAPTDNSTDSGQTAKPKACVLKYILFVGNLPYDVTKEQLLDHFRKTGGTMKIRIPKEKGTDQGKGYAFIEFRDRISYRVGLRLHETTLAGRTINVEFTSIGGNNPKRREKLKAKNQALKKFKMPLEEQTT